MSVTQIFILIVLVLSLGIALGRVASILFYRYEATRAQEKANCIIKAAKTEASKIKRSKILEAKERFLRLKADFEQSVGRRKAKLLNEENNLENKEKAIAQQQAQLYRKQRALEKVQVELDYLKNQQAKQLASMANLSVEVAHQQLMEVLESEARAQAAGRMKIIVDEAKTDATREAKKVIMTTMQRIVAEQTIEHCTSTVNIDNETLKGKIIGKEGRNIRALAATTGVEIIVDDTPNTVVLSSFDPIRREIARLTLQKLIQDGRIHPTRIEETVAKTEKNIEQEMINTGERTAIELGIYGMHEELIKLVGKMRYRTSYGQNLLHHSREVAHLATTMASELGLNNKLAKRAGLLHDIGKVVSEKYALSHAILGMELAEKYKEHPEVCNAIGAHHDEIEMLSMLSPIVQACDVISSARPGARREILEAYVQRLHDMEDIALSFDGVKKCYAIQAGRELRVIVDSTSVTDEVANTLSFEISTTIEQRMQYPGQVKVTVIRETRATNYAR